MFSLFNQLLLGVPLVPPASESPPRPVPPRAGRAGSPTLIPAPPSCLLLKFFWVSAPAAPPLRSVLFVFPFCRLVAAGCLAWRQGGDKWGTRSTVLPGLGCRPGAGGYGRSWLQEPDPPPDSGYLTAHRAAPHPWPCSRMPKSPELRGSQTLSLGLSEPPNPFAPAPIRVLCPIPSATKGPGGLLKHAPTSNSSPTPTPENKTQGPTSASFALAPSTPPPGGGASVGEGAGSRAPRVDSIAAERGWPLPPKRWDWWCGETQPQDRIKLPLYRTPPPRGWDDGMGGWLARRPSRRSPVPASLFLSSSSIPSLSSTPLLYCNNTV